MKTHYIIATPRNAGPWTMWGGIDFEGTQQECEDHLAKWGDMDQRANQNGLDAASCDSRFLISKEEYDAEIGRV